MAQWREPSPPTSVARVRFQCGVMWVEFVIGSYHALETFPPGSMVFLPPANTDIPKFQFDQDKGPA